jgi:hypothetical protein
MMPCWETMTSGRDAKDALEGIVRKRCVIRLNAEFAFWIKQ